MASPQRVVIGGATLWLGDCREIVPTLPSVDACVTDPPYGVNLTGKRGHYRHEPQANRGMAYASYEDTEANFHGEVLPRLRDTLPRVRSAAVFMDSRHIWALPPGDLGGIFLPNGCGRGSWGFQCFMHVVFYGIDPYLRAGKGCIPNGRYGLYGNDSNTIDHPCAKPLAAILWAVHRVSLPGETILDPFAGSFTTAVAALQLGRRFVGCEIDERYFAIGCRRVEAAYAQMSLFPPPPPPAAPTQGTLFATDGRRR